METWLSYKLSDLLLFSPATYFRLYELNNMAVWPLQAAMLALALVILVLSRRSASGADRIVAFSLALSWVTVAWWFHYLLYAQINLAARWFALLFFIEALLLLASSFTTGRKNPPRAPVNIPGLILFLYAMLIHPFIGILNGQSWNSIELFGIAPDPTALGTLGILLMRNKAMPRFLYLIPLIWCITSGLTYQAMGITYGLATPFAAVMAILASILMHQSRYRKLPES